MAHKLGVPPEKAKGWRTVGRHLPKDKTLVRVQVRNSLCDKTPKRVLEEEMVGSAKYSCA